MGERRRKIRAIDVDAIRERGFDRLGQSAFAQPLSQRAWWAPWRVARLRCWAENEGLVLVGVGNELSQAARCDFRNRREVGPLIAMRLEPVVEKFGVAGVAGRALQG
jgi:hypothetical protein